MFTFQVLPPRPGEFSLAAILEHTLAGPEHEKHEKIHQNKNYIKISVLLVDIRALLRGSTSGPPVYFLSHLTGNMNLPTVILL